MPQVDIYGHSDDLIEITGDIEEEIYANLGRPTEFALLGYHLSAEYVGAGNWRIDVVEEPRQANYEMYQVGECDKYNDYSDVVRINQPLNGSVRKL